MFGHILGKVLSLPVRIVNVPVHVAMKSVGLDVDPDPLGDVADVIEEGVEAAFGEEG